jgi:hypothetical protein
MSEVTHVEFNMLSSKLLLITLECKKFFTVDDGTAPASSGCASSAWRCQGDARTLSVDRNNAIKPTLPFRLGGNPFGRFESRSKEKDAVSTRGT